MEKTVLPKDRPKCPGRELNQFLLITSPTPNQLSYFVPLKYVRTYIHTYICMYIHTYIHTYTNVRTYIHTYVRTYIHTYIHTYIRTYVRTYLHTYIHTYIHTYDMYFYASNKHTTQCIAIQSGSIFHIAVKSFSEMP